MAHVLIVEDETGLRESLLEGLSVAFPEASLSAHGSVEEALEAIEAVQPQLVISDIRLPGKSGIDLLLTAKERWPGIRFILITAYANVATHALAREHGAYRLLQKPFALNMLIKTIQEALMDGSAGEGQGVSILELVQLANLGRKSLTIYAQRGAESGEISLVNGEVIHAQSGPIEGRMAFLEMVRWQRRDAEVGAWSEPPLATVSEPFHRLILEALRVLDEENEKQAREKVSQPRQRPASEIERAHPTPEPASRRQPPDTEPPDGLPARAELEALETINGFLGVCLVNSESGGLVKIQGACPVDVEDALVGNTEVVRAERRALASLGLDDQIEDILISLESQYHLLRLSKSNPDLILYLVLDRTVANLAIARQQLGIFAEMLEN